MEIDSAIKSMVASWARAQLAETPEEYKKHLIIAREKASKLPPVRRPTAISKIREMDIPDG